MALSSGCRTYILCSLMLCRKLNKLGTFNLSQLGKSKSPIAEFMRNARKNNDNFEESLLKLVSSQYNPSPVSLFWIVTGKSAGCG